MVTVQDVAAFVLERSGPMSAMKLQKLVYYGQAWATVLLGRPLFPEPVRAWAHGPVVHELFDHHRGRFVVGPEWRWGDPRRLERSERELVLRVLESYGHRSAEQLSEMTHAEEPWQRARAGVAEGERWAAVITPAEMARYYGRMKPPFAAR